MGCKAVSLYRKIPREGNARGVVASKSQVTLPWRTPQRGRVCSRRSSIFLGWRDQTTGERDELRRLLKDVKRDLFILCKLNTEKKLTYELGRGIASHMSYSGSLELRELANVAVNSLMTMTIRGLVKTVHGTQGIVGENLKGGNSCWTQ